MIQINGKKYEGQCVSINNGNITITNNGENILVNTSQEKEITINGDIHGNVDCANLTINGNVGGDVDGANIKIKGSVAGDIDGANVNVRK